MLPLSQMEFHSFPWVDSGRIRDTPPAAHGYWHWEMGADFEHRSSSRKAHSTIVRCHAKAVRPAIIGSVYWTEIGCGQNTNRE